MLYTATKQAIAEFDALPVNAAGRDAAIDKAADCFARESVAAGTGNTLATAKHAAAWALKSGARGWLDRTTQH